MKARELKTRAATLGLALASLLIWPCVMRAQLTDAARQAASEGLLQIVPYTNLPPFGNFYSWQIDGPPRPEAIPDLTTYDFGDGVNFLIDDRFVRYDLMTMDDPTPPGEGSGPPYTWDPSDGSVLWTVQEYSGPVLDSDPVAVHWRTVVGRLKLRD